MFLLRIPDKIFLKLAIDHKNVEKYATAYFDNTGILVHAILRQFQISES